MENLFGNEEEDPPTSNPATITSGLMKFGGLFSDNKDHKDWFGPIKITRERKKEEQKKSLKLLKKKTACAVPLFGGGGGENSLNLMSEAAAKRKGKFRENKRVDLQYLILLFMTTSSLDNLFESLTIDKTNDLFFSEAMHPPSIFAKKPRRLPWKMTTRRNHLSKFQCPSYRYM